MNDLNAQKLAFARLLLPLCPLLFINGTLPKCVLPEDLRGHKDLGLRIGQNRHVLSIPDLELTMDGFSGTISQRGRLTHVVVPWIAVYRMSVIPPFEGPHVMWMQQALALEEKEAAPTSPERPSLRLIKAKD